MGAWPSLRRRLAGAWAALAGRDASCLRTDCHTERVQRHLAMALDASDDAFTLFDAKDRLVAYNARYPELYQTLADMLRPGLTFEQLVRTTAASGQYAGITPANMEDWVQERLALHRSGQVRFEQRHADGRWLEIVETTTADGGSVAIRRDITARKRVEEALRQELAFEQTLLDALPYPVTFQDKEGRHLGCNAAFEQAFGVAREQVLGSTIAELLPADAAAFYAQGEAALFAQPGPLTTETTMRLADGALHHLQLVKAPFHDADGQVAGIITTIMDVTGQKGAEERLVQAAKLATIGQIASEIAHELNQPLSIIRMSAESCLDRMRAGTITPDRLAAKLGTVVGQVERMAEMVNHLRVFTRRDNGKKRLFQPTAVAEQTIRLLKTQFELDDIQLSAELTGECGEVLGHPGQMEQVILNLLSNARDAVRGNQPPGARQVTVTATPAVMEGGRAVAIRVEDNGGGVPAPLWPSVFEPFFTTKAEGAGTGLGLSISANIVSSMGGRIDGCNTEQGAAFTVTLPCREAEVEPPPPATPAQPPSFGKMHGRRVLVVDDEKLAADCIAEYLADQGYLATTANSARQALAALAEGAADLPIDVIVSDVRMPGMEGDALLAEVRRRRPGLPAILMTGHVLPEHTGLEDALTQVISKPVALDQLERRIAGLLAPQGEGAACRR